MGSEQKNTLICQSYVILTIPPVTLYMKLLHVILPRQGSTVYAYVYGIIISADVAIDSRNPPLHQDTTHCLG